MNVFTAILELIQVLVKFLIKDACAGRPGIVSINKNFSEGTMLKIFYAIASNVMVSQLDPSVIELQKRVIIFRALFLAAAFTSLVLAVVVVMQRISLSRERKLAGALKSAPVKTVKRKGAKGAVRPAELPDPGLIFRFLPADEKTTERVISIGSTSGDIKTCSTEITDSHLKISIRRMNSMDEGRSSGAEIIDEYIVDLNGEGKALINYPGESSFRPMLPGERIYIMDGSDPAGGPAYRTIDPRQPVRMRLGNLLNDQNKFVNGYFEFHLFNSEHQKTGDNVARLQKVFFVRLYRIYPGYDLSSPDSNGLYPMIPPYKGAGAADI